jgi:hypothetical protein
MKGARISYSADELAWIKACCDLPRRELHALFVQIWKRPDVSQANLTALCKRQGWLTGRTGRFVKGQVPPNAGKKGICAAGSEKGWFPKGNRPHTWRGAGHESIDNRDGYVWLIVNETNPYTGAPTRRVQKHKWLWEKAHGPVPKGHVLKCLDGDKTNCAPSNWEAIPMALLPRLNGRSGRDYDSAPAELKPLILATAKLEHAARERTRKQSGSGATSKE